MSNIILTEEQQEAYNAIGKYKTLFLEGAAGCGKTIVVAEKLKNDSSGKLLLCATTNQACRILSDKLATGLDIPTLQSVLGMKPRHDGTTKNEDELLEFIFSSHPRFNTYLQGVHLIVDESSMICRHVQQYILDLIKYNNLETVTFVGDRYQLPCVKKNAFDYDLVDKIITLKFVQRANGDLLNYYNQIREDIISGDEITTHTSQAKYFDRNQDFVDYMNSLDASKCIISWTNDAADSYTKLLDKDRLYEGQECTALGNCSYPHLYRDDYIGVVTNSNIKIVKIFNDHSAMCRESARDSYDYRLPKLPSIDIYAIAFVKAINEGGETIYMSVWKEPRKMKDDIYLNKMTREYRKFLDSIKHLIPFDIWNRFAKNDGYPRSLNQIKKFVNLDSKIIKQDAIYWNNYIAINEAVPTRSIFSTTAHRVQGTTVEYAGINWTNLSKSTDDRLKYVALTRASKELVFYIGGEDEV